MNHEQMRAVSEDVRGRIVEVMANQDYQHVVVVSFKSGAKRGDHYHPKSTQTSYVLKGRLHVYTKPKDGGGVVALELGPGWRITHEPGEAHSFVALEDSDLLCMSAGPRGGEGFEDDTVRLGVGALENEHKLQVGR